MLIGSKENYNRLKGILEKRKPGQIHTYQVADVVFLHL